MGSEMCIRDSLMHDCYGESVEAALQIVDIMEKQGYEFVTADELIIN